jgi:hypothetical protein
MATATFNKFNDFTEQLARGVHDLDAHTFKIALSNTAPIATNTALADIVQISAGNGYTTNGTATTISISETAGTTTVNGTQVVFTASGGSIGPFRYAVLFNESATAPADALVGWWDYGTAVTLADTETFTWRPSNASPGAIFTLS